MQEFSNKAGTEDWLKVSKGFKISTYVISESSALADEDRPFTKDHFDTALKKVSRPQRRGQASS